MFEDEMLTIEELAAYLKLKPQTIYKWAQTGKIPGAKFGKEWRFRRSTIEKWIDSHIPPLHVTGFPGSAASRAGGRPEDEPIEAASQHGGSVVEPASDGTTSAAELAERSDRPETWVYASPPSTPERLKPSARAEASTAHGERLARESRERPREPVSNGTTPPSGDLELEGSILKSAPGLPRPSGLKGKRESHRTRRVPVEKVAGARRGTRPVRRSRGPDSN